MHGQPSGLEMISALASDHVLRYNIRVITQSKEYQPSSFVKSAFGSHHLRLQDYIARCWNSLIDQLAPDDCKNLKPLPVLQIVDSKEAFGLVPSEHAATYGGLYIKEEPANDSQLVDLSLQDPDMQEAALRQLDIDPYLVHVPAVQLRLKPENSDSATGLSLTGTGDQQSTACHEPEVVLSQGQNVRDNSPELEIVEQTHRPSATEDSGKRKLDTPPDDATLSKKLRIAVRGDRNVSMLII